MATREQVDAARSKGGKPRDANRVAGRTAAQNVYEGGEGSARASDGSTVARGPDGNVYRYNPKYDYTTIERADGTSSAPMRGNQLPNGMNAYIDKVLQMSGMNDEQSAAPANVPTPTPRPDIADTSGVPDSGMEIPVPASRPDSIDAAVANSDAATFGEALAGLLGGAAVGAGVGYLTRNASKAKSAIDSSIDAIDGDADVETAADTRAEGAQQLEAEKRAALPAPQQKLPAPDNVSQSIDAVDGAPAADAPPLALTDADAPYTPRNPAPPPPAAAQDVYGRDIPQDPNATGWPQGTERWAQPPMPTVDASTASAAPSRAEVLQQIVNMPPRQAIAALRNAGIDINNLAPDEMRILAEASNNIRNGARQAAGDAVSGAVKSAVRGAAR